MRIETEPAVRGFWRALESPVVTHWLGESTFDFYARIFSSRLTARRVVARVDAILEEAPFVKSFVLKPNGHFRGFRAGQHVNLTVEIDGIRHTRSYSPSNAPSPSRTVVLTVKRYRDGRVSQWLHDRLRIGDIVELGPAFGDFTLPSGEPKKLLFIAGGSGITPIASLVRELGARRESLDAVVISYDRTYSDLIFARELKELARSRPGLRVHFALTRDEPVAGDLAGRFSSAHLEAVAPDVHERHTFVCGPRALVDCVRALWAERELHSPLETETFAPPELAPLSSDVGATLRVSATRAARSFAANTAVPLLVQAERAGLSPPSGCRQGICFSCACRKKAGIVRNLTTGAISAEPDEDIRLCITAPLSDVTLDL